MYLIILFSIVAVACIITLLRNKDNWSNTYSGWPGPLEMGASHFNIPALQGGKSIGYHYKFNNNSPNGYLTLKDFPDKSDLN